MKTIFDSSFRYNASFNTDLKKTFARIRRDQRAEAGKAAPTQAANHSNVSSIAKRTAGH